MALSNLERCIVNALKALADAALQALKAAIKALILQLEAELLILIAQVLPFKIAKQFLQAQAALVKAANDTIKSASNLLPTGKISGPCFSLSLINLSISDRLAPVTDTLDSIQTDILTLAALVDLNAIAQRAIQELIDSLNEVIDAIDEILSIRTAPQQPVIP